MYSATLTIESEITAKERKIKPNLSTLGLRDDKGFT